jgi:succinylglutamic semialdehyde dehydrogenase
MDLKPIRFKGDYISGQFVREKRPDEEFSKASPANLKDEIIEVEAHYEHVAKATSAARSSYVHWRGSSLEERKNAILRLKQALKDQAPQIEEALARETGRPIWDVSEEMTQTSHMIDAYVETALNYIPESVNTRYIPRGVVAVISSYATPLRFSTGHIISALLSGNCIVFKGSEETPAFNQVFFEALQVAEFPSGVVNMIQGSGEQGRRLAASEDVEVVCFAGSYETGLKIKQDTINHFWKVLNLHLGGKNASIIFPDCNLDLALKESIRGAFTSAGQRAESTSRLFVHKDSYSQFLDGFYDMAKKLSIGSWEENKFMGPLISKTAVENYVRFQGISTREGTESLMRGKALEREPGGYYVSPSVSIVKKPNMESIFQKTEIFGPNVAVYEYSSVEEAVELFNLSSYGLVLSVFSNDRGKVDTIRDGARVGSVHWNTSTVHYDPFTPQIGRGKSGNQTVSGVFGIRNCTVPQVFIEEANNRKVSLQGFES